MLQSHRATTAPDSDKLAQVCVSASQKQVLDVIQLPSKHASLLTTDEGAARLHVVPMKDICFDSMWRALDRYAGRFDTVIAFKPTGWCMRPGAAWDPPHHITV